MKSEYNYDLYKKYADLCLNKNQYDSLVKWGIIPDGLENIFDRSYDISGSLFSVSKEGVYSGKIPKIIASLNESLFLENWCNYYNFKNTCMLVYKDFLVISSEPKMDSKSDTLIPASTLPVAIPIHRIKDLSLSETKDFNYNPIYNLKITFDNGSTYHANLFTCASYSNGFGKTFGPYLQGCNWSFEVNQILLKKKLKYTPGYENYNQMVVLNELKIIMINAKNFSRVENAIMNLECSTSVTNKLLDSIYSSDTLLVFTMVKYLKELKESKCDSVLIDKLEEIKQIMKKLNSQIDEYKEKIKGLNKELENKKLELEIAGLFKKMNIKNEINELELEIKDYNKKINSSCVPSFKIADVCSALLSHSSNFDYDISKNKLALELYETCAKKGIEELNSEDDEIIFEAICKRLNIDSSMNPKELFVQGKKSYSEKDKPSRKSILLEKIHDEELYKFEKDRIKFVGKDKYFNKVNLEIKKKNSMSELMDLGYQSGKLATQTRAVKSDEYILGGLASGIGGAAAGLATASDIREKNIKAENYAREKREQGYKLMRDSKNMKSSLDDEIFDLELSKRTIENGLCDTEHTERYFEYLDCKVTNYKTKIDGNMSIDIEINFKKEPVIKNIPIIIDGSLLINIKNNNKIVGNAYLNAPGFDILSTKEIGFNCEQKYSVIGLPISEEFNKDLDYQFEIEPVNIWMIEK